MCRLFAVDEITFSRIEKVHRTFFAPTECKNPFLIYKIIINVILTKLDIECSERVYLYEYLYKNFNRKFKFRVIINECNEIDPIQPLCTDELMVIVCHKSLYSLVTADFFLILGSKHDAIFPFSDVSNANISKRKYQVFHWVKICP